MRTIFKLVLLALALTTAGCGGGSSVSSGTPVTPPPGTGTSGSTIISGKAIVGTPTPGTVNIYKIDPNTGAIDKSTDLLKSVRTLADGSYSADLGNYTGPVYLEVFGPYRDEATGATLEIPENTPLKAAVAEVSGSVSISVTPLTTLAISKATSLKPSDISAANALISDLFKVDIINVKPVSFFDTNAIRTADQKAKDYTMALAALSQMATTSSLNEVVAYYSTNITQGVMSELAAQKFQTAVAAIMGPSMVSYYSSTSLGEVGIKTVEIGIFIDGPPAPYMGFELTLKIPQGVSVKSQGLNEPGTSTLLPGELTTSGVASGIVPYASFEAPATTATGGNVYLTIATANGLAAGEVATLRCYYKPGLAPTLSVFAVTHFKPVDGFGNDLSSSYTTRLGWKLLLI
jgi:hypothetical protein